MASAARTARSTAVAAFASTVAIASAAACRCRLAAVARPEPRRPLAPRRACCRSGPPGAPPGLEAHGPRRRASRASPSPAAASSPWATADGAQHVIALDQADGKIALDGEGRRALGRRVRRPARHARPWTATCVYAIGTEGDLVCLEAGHRQGALAQEPAAGLRRPHDVDVEVQRVAARGRRPRDRHARARAARLVAARQAARGKEIWRTAAADLGPKGKDGAGYSAIVISNGGGVKQYVQLMGRGLVGVRAADGKFLWGYNQRRQRRGQHPDPDRARGLRLRLHRLPDRRRAAEAHQVGRRRRGRGGLLPRREDVPEPPRRPRAGGRPHLRRPRPQQGLPHLRRARHGQGGLGRRHPQRGHGLGGGRVRRRQPLLPLPERRRAPDRGDARGLQGEGLVHDPRA